MRQDTKACFSRVGQQCTDDYSVDFADYQRTHLLRQKVLKASADLSTSYEIATACETHCEEMLIYDTAAVEGSVNGISRSSLYAYKDKLTAHQRNTTRMLQHLAGTATLVNL